MTANGYLQLGLYLIALIGLAWPLGVYMARVYKDELPGFVRWLKPVENGFYRLSGVKPGDDMPWTRYAFAMIAFNLMGFLAVYALQRFQVWLPLNPEGLAQVDSLVARSGPEADLGFLPVRAGKRDMTVVVKKRDGAVVALLPLRPWEY